MIICLQWKNVNWHWNTDKADYDITDTQFVDCQCTNVRCDISAWNKLIDMACTRDAAGIVTMEHRDFNDILIKTFGSQDDCI